MALSQELRLDVCHVHKSINLKEFYPGHAFGQYIFYPPRSCTYPGCSNDAYHTVIGLEVPNAFPEITPKAPDKGTLEIFMEARTLLSGGSAIERLTYFLTTRIVPMREREFLARKLIRLFAEMTLAKLGIDPQHDLSEAQKHQILIELNLYPKDYV